MKIVKEVIIGQGGPLVKPAPFVRMVAGSNFALSPPRRDLGQVLHSQLSVVFRRVNSDTVSML